MIKSMTGFGRAETADEGRRVTVEVRSVNGRYGEYSVRLPRTLSALEPRLRRLLQQRMARGTVSLSVSLSREDRSGLPGIDLEAARHYRDLLKGLKRELKLSGKVDLRTMVRFPEIFAAPESPAGEEEGWHLVRGTLEQALSSIDEMRRHEGERLQADLEKRLARVERGLSQITRLAPRRAAEARKALQDRIAKALPAASRDPELARRLAQEAALMADRLDVTEECVRLKSHLQAFRAAIKGPQPVGKKLDFLLQEMNREANTIGSKANHSGIAQASVGLKEEIEKMREQAQNIE
jgi:uncharacterized protein (TIGR00255 family)